MAIKKIEIRPKGDGTFPDVLYPRTSVDQVDGLQTALDGKAPTSHASDSTIHVTSADKTKINSALQPATYSSTNVITNVGDSYATRTFPAINFTGTGNQLWESALTIPSGTAEGIWGVLELDFAGFSASAGGAKIVIELGVNWNATGDSVGFMNTMKIVHMSTSFASNFSVQFEHRPASRALLIQLYKRTYNDFVSLKATLNITKRGTMSAYDWLNKFTNGTFYSATAPTAIQQDLFGSVASGKTAIASATSDKGVPTSPNDSFAQMASNIRLIAGGRKFATGVTLSDAGGYLQVRGIDFIPAVIGVWIHRGTGSESSFGLYAGNSTTNVGYNVNAISNLGNNSFGGFTALNGGFNASMGGQSQYGWVAIGY